MKGLKEMSILYNIMKGLKEMSIPYNIIKGLKEMSILYNIMKGLKKMSIPYNIMKGLKEMSILYNIMNNGKNISYNNNMDINYVINPNTKRRVKIERLIFKKLTHVISPTSGRKIKINGPSYNRIYKHEKISKLNKLIEIKNKNNLDGLDDDAKEYIKEYQSKQIGKEMQDEIIKLTKNMKK